METATIKSPSVWGGGNEPLKSSYGKLMMWFFIMSDALTFSGFLAAYGMIRYMYLDSWPIADEVFTHFPFLHGDYPMLYVALMTFILIMSSVTMVLAVDAGHQMKKKAATWYMFLTIVGGAIFLGSQAWEWGHFIHGSYGAVKLNDDSIAHIVDGEGKKVALWDITHPSAHGTHGEHAEPTLAELQKAFANTNYKLRLQDRTVLDHSQAIEKLNNSSKKTVYGSNLTENEFGRPLFANFFFFITGFHGFHVFSGVLLNIIIFVNILLGTYDRRKNYEMVEKVGLYWHFVDLVWVFVFTFFYLV